MVELKKKVTLRTKAAETSEEVQKPQVALKKKQLVQETAPPSSPMSGEKDESKGKGKWYAAALAGLLVLGGGGYYLSQQGGENDAPVAEVVEPTKSADDADGETTNANQGEQRQTETQDETVDNVSSEAAEGGIPAQPAQSQDDASPANNGTPAPVADVPVRNNPSTSGTVSRTAPTPTASVTGTIEEEAREVIRGKYGNGDVRKRNLGDRYAEIQSKVNEMYRNGQVR